VIAVVGVADLGGADVEVVAGAAEGSSANAFRPTTLDNATPNEVATNEVASSEVITSEFTTERAPIGNNEFHNRRFQGRIIDAFLGERQ
jgi:hypothetical protein